MSCKTLKEKVFNFSLMAYIMFEVLSSVNDDIYVNKVRYLFILKMYRTDHQKISRILYYSFTSKDFNL